MIRQHFLVSLQIAKKKTRGGNSMTGKSPAIQNIHRGASNTVQKKSYEHKEFIEARCLKHVVDIKDDNGKYLTTYRNTMYTIIIYLLHTKYVFVTLQAKTVPEILRYIAYAVYHRNRILMCDNLFITAYAVMR